MSGTHAEAWVDSSGRLVVRDLGSTNGTFINGQRVNEALVSSGQVLRLGNLELVFDAEGATSQAPPPAPVALNLPPPPVHAPAPARVTATTAPAPTVAGPDDCRNHPGVMAVAICNKCGVQQCSSCAKQQKVGAKVIHFCGACGGQCKDLKLLKKEAAAEAGRTKDFPTAIKRAFSFPFRGNGLIMLFGGTIFYGVIDALPKFGLYGIVLTVILYGYLFAFMQRVVVTSAAGEEDPPDFPEVTDIGSDIVTPFMQLLVTFIVAFGPAIAANIAVGPELGTAVMLLGLVYFPMALLGVAMSDSYSALNPIFVMSSIMKVTKPYIICCIVFGLLVALRVFVQDSIYAIPIPILPQIAFWFFFLMILMIQMRILGMLYCLNKNKLGWGL